MIGKHQSARKLYNYLGLLRSALSSVCARKISKSRTATNFATPLGENRDYQLVRRYPKGFCTTFSGFRDKLILVKEKSGENFLHNFCQDKRVFSLGLATRRDFNCRLFELESTISGEYCVAFSVCARRIRAEQDILCFPSDFFKLELDRKISVRASDH